MLTLHLQTAAAAACIAATRCLNRSCWVLPWWAPRSGAVPAASFLRRPWPSVSRVPPRPRTRPRTRTRTPTPQPAPTSSPPSSKDKLCPTASEEALWSLEGTTAAAAAAADPALEGHPLLVGHASVSPPLGALAGRLRVRRALAAALSTPSASLRFPCDGPWAPSPRGLRWPRRARPPLLLPPPLLLGQLLPLRNPPSSIFHRRRSRSHSSSTSLRAATTVQRAKKASRRWRASWRPSRRRARPRPPWHTS